MIGLPQSKDATRFITRLSRNQPCSSTIRSIPRPSLLTVIGTTSIIWHPIASQHSWRVLHPVFRHKRILGAVDAEYDRAGPPRIRNSIIERSFSRLVRSRRRPVHVRRVRQLSVHARSRHLAGFAVLAPEHAVVMRVHDHVECVARLHGIWAGAITGVLRIAEQVGPANPAIGSLSCSCVWCSGET